MVLGGGCGVVLLKYKKVDGKCVCGGGDRTVWMLKVMPWVTASVGVGWEE